MLNEDTIGVTFPVPHTFLRRFFEEGKTVFIKNSKFTKIEPGMKLIFYSSVEVRAFVGEGMIENVEYLTPEGVIKKYRKQLFLTREECFEYAKITPKRKYKVSKFLTLVLKDITKYSKPVKPPRFISMYGRYISRSEYKGILAKS